MSIFNTVLTKLPLGKFFASTALVALMPSPFLAITPASTTTVVNAAQSTSIVNDTSLADLFFDSNTAPDDIMSLINQKMEFVSSRDAYPASLSVVKTYAGSIERAADAAGVPEDVALGVALLENGGSTSAKSPAGAMGIFQLMPSTARGLGLTVNSKKDDRTDPELSIKAGVKYLAQNYQIFGDWGLSTWSYHAGAGNVAKALKIYAKERGTKLAGVSDAAALRQYVADNNITVDTLLSDAGVKKFTKTLDDDSAGYPYKVLATAALFRQATA